jgi:hypothetical protein
VRVFFAAIFDASYELGDKDNEAHPEVCCTTYIATYCDVSTKKVQLAFRDRPNAPAKRTQAVRTDHLVSALERPTNMARGTIGNCGGILALTRRVKARYG